MHRNPKRFRGKFTGGSVDCIRGLIERTESATLLDYGSGKGFQYTQRRQHEQWGGILPTCYDPGYIPYSAKPTTKFDGVICTDVAEHIPKSDVGAFLVDVIGFAKKFVFFVIATAPSRHKRLPDGRNVHLTVEPPDWWRSEICKINADVIVETLFDV
jgi:hypothetical protein